MEGWILDLHPLLAAALPCDVKTSIAQPLSRVGSILKRLCGLSIPEQLLSLCVSAGGGSNIKQDKERLLIANRIEDMPGPAAGEHFAYREPATLFWTTVCLHYIWGTPSAARPPPPCHHPGHRPLGASAALSHFLHLCQALSR